MTPETTRPIFRTNLLSRVMRAIKRWVRNWFEAAKSALVTHALAAIAITVFAISEILGIQDQTRELFGGSAWRGIFSLDPRDCSHGLVSHSRERFGTRIVRAIRREMDGKAALHSGNPNHNDNRGASFVGASPGILEYRAQSGRNEHNYKRPPGVRNIPGDPKHHIKQRLQNCPTGAKCQKGGYELGSRSRHCRNLNGNTLGRVRGCRRADQDRTHNRYGDGDNYCSSKCRN